MTSIRFVPPAEIARMRGAVSDPHRRAQIMADALRLNTLSMIFYAGSGHIGSSFSTMDLLCWLWTQVLDAPAARASDAGDIYFSSKGHDAPGLYALLIGLGRIDSQYSTRLRRLHGLPGHPDVATPFMITNTGPLGMGISKARGMAIGNRLQGKRGRLFVVVGDGELQEGQFWESLQPTANGGFSEITVIVDHNKMQSDTWLRDVSDLGDLEGKVRAFGWEVARCDGHDFAAIDASLTKLLRLKRPRMLIADTIKGRGVSFMEASAVGEDGLYKFHSGAPAPELYQRGVDELRQRIEAALAALGVEAPSYQEFAPPTRSVPERPQRLIDAYADELVELGRKHPEIVALDGDLMVDCGALPFKREFPQRFIECGIAEQDMVSQAGALALKGLLPIVHSFACFLSTRPNEQIYNNATEHTRIIYHASLAGLVPSGPGHSHQSVRDISAVGSVPNLTLLQPCNEQETRLALRWAVEENRGSSYLRLVTPPCAIPFELPADHRLVLGRGTRLKTGPDGVMIAYGPVMLAQTYLAAELLERRGLRMTVVNLPWLNRVDGSWLEELVRGQRALFLIEDHYADLGQSAFVTRALCERAVAISTRVYGVEEVPVCAQNAEALEYHGLSAAKLAERVAAELSR